MEQDSIPVLESMGMMTTSDGGCKEDKKAEANLQLVSEPLSTEVEVKLSGESRRLLLPDSNVNIAEEDVEQGELIVDENIATGAGESIPTEKPTPNDSTLNTSADVSKTLIKQNIICCNCASSLSGYDVKAHKLRESINVSVFDMGKKSMEKKDVSILEVLTVLYISRSQQSWIVTKSLNEELLMCENCVGTLSLLYQMYNEYLSLSLMSGAAISKVIGANPQKIGSYRRFSGRVSNVSKLVRQPSKRVPGSSNASKRKAEGSGSGVLINKTNDRYFTSGNTGNKRILITRSKTNNSVRSGKQNDRERSQVKEKGKGLGGTEFIVGSKIVAVGKAGASSAQAERKSESTIILPELEADDNHDDSDSGNVCRRCGKSFKSSVGLKVHYASHLREDNKFKCKDCGKKFRKQDALDSHWKIDHEGFKPHKCPHEGCDRSFRLKDKLKLHIQVNHEKRKPFPCPKCEKSFRTKYHLKIHDVSQHIQGDNSFGCSQCRRKFDSREALDTHVAIHQGDKPFVCKICQKGFQTSSRLKLHGKSHEVIPSCICSVCGKAYKHPRDLRLHEVIHQDESTFRFACGDCPKKFYRIDLLRVHQSNEQHFSPETVGPTVTKLSLTNSPNKSKLKRIARKNISNGYVNEEEGQLFDELETQTVEKLKVRTKRPSKTKKNSNKKQKLSCNKTTSESFYQPNLAMISGDVIQHAPENVQLGNLLTQKYPSVEKVTDLFNTNLEDNRMTNLQEATSHVNSLAPLQPFQLPVTGHSARSTLYPLKDTSDRSLPSFCISAGAEQIGFDVISAFINNLN